MTGFKESFVVLSKTKKENEKEDETKRTYSVFLRSESGLRANVYSSDGPIPLNVRDELEIKMVKHQSTLLVESEEEEEVPGGGEAEWITLSSEDAPEVIKVLEPGVYEINIEKLLEDSPIIINKDGSYMVYLPSIFKKKRRLRR